ncbi:MAG: single-stranded DNA-binding protein [Brachybacterium sp.]|uniref:single-stranded DNA-binding protein n=1 Tax=Brachybacterium sp. TaxID=1891286 RepID=UPI0026479B11|nr:single-stranded DNA-binding protein [Brachybacterium sp.]MDN5687085.1 single-stranded DNA-binding protein [Brachybacterium sp.]
MSDNTLTITGNLADEVELRFTQSGIPVASFVVMQTKREKQGQDYVDGAKNGLRITVWRDQAENVAESIGKGDRVTVTGHLEPQQWQDRQSGDNRYGWELVADEVAVSLRWATAKPNKVNRRQRGGSFGGGQQGGYGQPQGAPQGGQEQGGDPWAGGGQGGGYDDPPF